MKPALDPHTYYVKQFRKGWRASVRNSRLFGWGATIELAIYDWKRRYAASILNAA